MNTDRTLIIVPTYNERENAPALIEQLLRIVADADVLLVDDNSPDGTADLAEKMFGTSGRFSVLRRKGPRGLGRSYVDGYRKALEGGYARLVQFTDRREGQSKISRKVIFESVLMPWQLRFQRAGKDAQLLGGANDEIARD
ncbi:MAG: glycosyltransferase [Acidobacteria bacterium]|nr:glycosyltransferase [Acidobacteriota bacterium]